MRSFALLALASAASAQYRGFNYGSTDNNGAVRQQADFEAMFNKAKNLAGTSGFTSARLYTMIQANTANTVSSAIQAAIDTQTTLLLGLWASAGQDAFNNELSALSSAIGQYGTALTDLIAGISVGSEDLYRVSPTGIENNSGAGASPDQLVGYISQVRDTIKGTAASGASVGHVDTWNVWTNGSNNAVISAVDWLGVDEYPYFQTTDANGIENQASVFFDSYNATVAVAQGKEVWITETGYPTQGPTAGQAVPSVENAAIFWQDVGCKVLGNINTWWYTLYDPQPSTSDISFGIVGPNLDSAPLFDLSCSSKSSDSSSSETPSSTKTKAVIPDSTSSADSTLIVDTSSKSTRPTTAVGPVDISSVAITPTDSASTTQTTGTSSDGTTSSDESSMTPTPSSSVTPSTGGAQTSAESSTTLMTIVSSVVLLFYLGAQAI